MNRRRIGTKLIQINNKMERSSHRWVDIIENDITEMRYEIVNCTYTVRSNVNWWDFVNAAMNLPSTPGSSKWVFKPSPVHISLLS